jgi:hypothetical protein
VEFIVVLQYQTAIAISQKFIYTICRPRRRFVNIVYAQFVIKMPARKRKTRKRIGPGRPKLYGPRILLALAEGTLEAIDKVLIANETRQDYIRSAIAAELARRRSR